MVACFGNSCKVMPHEIAEEEERNLSRSPSGKDKWTQEEADNAVRCLSCGAPINYWRNSLGIVHECAGERTVRIQNNSGAYEIEHQVKK